MTNAAKTKELLMMEELLALIRSAPGHHDGMTVIEAVNALGMTKQQAAALCQKRVAERLGMVRSQ